MDFPKLGGESFQNIDMVAQEPYLRSLGDLFVIIVWNSCPLNMKTAAWKKAMPFLNEITQLFQC